MFLLMDKPAKTGDITKAKILDRAEGAEEADFLGKEIWQGYDAIWVEFGDEDEASYSDDFPVLRWDLSPISEEEFLKIVPKGFRERFHQVTSCKSCHRSWEYSVTPRALKEWLPSNWICKPHRFNKDTSLIEIGPWVSWSANGIWIADVLEVKSLFHLDKLSLPNYAYCTGRTISGDKCRKYRHQNLGNLGGKSRPFWLSLDWSCHLHNQNDTELKRFVGATIFIDVTETYILVPREKPLYYRDFSELHEIPIEEVDEVKIRALVRIIDVQSRYNQQKTEKELANKQ